MSCKKLLCPNPGPGGCGSTSADSCPYCISQCMCFCQACLAARRRDELEGNKAVREALDRKFPHLTAKPAKKGRYCYRKTIFLKLFKHKKNYYV